jgi:hypothetical protein
MSEYLDRIEQRVKILSIKADAIESLGCAFMTVGQHIVGNQLIAISNQIQESADDINKSVSQHIHESFQQAQKTSATILKTALTAGRLNEDTKPKKTSG